MGPWALGDLLRGCGDFFSATRTSFAATSTSSRLREPRGQGARGTRVSPRLRDLLLGHEKFFAAAGGTSSRPRELLRGYENVFSAMRFVSNPITDSNALKTNHGPITIFYSGARRSFSPREAQLVYFFLRASSQIEKRNETKEEENKTRIWRWKFSLSGAIRL